MISHNYPAISYLIPCNLCSQKDIDIYTKKQMTEFGNVHNWFLSCQDWSFGFKTMWACTTHIYTQHNNSGNQHWDLHCCKNLKFHMCLAQLLPLVDLKTKIWYTARFIRQFCTLSFLECSIWRWYIPSKCYPLSGLYSGNWEGHNLSSCLHRNPTSLHYYFCSTFWRFSGIRVVYLLNTQIYTAPCAPHCNIHLQNSATNLFT